MVEGHKLVPNTVKMMPSRKRDDCNNASRIESAIRQRSKALPRPQRRSIFDHRRPSFTQTLTQKLNFRTGTRYGRSSPESCSTTDAALDHHADDGSVLTPWSDRHDRWTGITPDHRRSRCEYDASNRHDGRRPEFKLHQKLQRPCRKQPLSTEITYLVGHCGRGLI